MTEQQQRVKLALNKNIGVGCVGCAVTCKLFQGNLFKCVFEWEAHLPSLTLELVHPPPMAKTLKLALWNDLNQYFLSLSNGQCLTTSLLVV